MTFLTFSWLADGVIFLSAIFIAAYIYMTRNFSYWKKRDVTEIPPVPFFGNFAKFCTFQKSPGYIFKSFYEKSEKLPYVGFYIFDKPYLLLRDPEIIKRVLVKDFNYFSDKLMSSSKNDVIGNNCLLIVKSGYWKYIRTKFTNLFTPGKLKIMLQNVQDVRNNLDNYMDSLRLEGSGKLVDVKEVSAKFTTDFIGLAAFGLQLNSLTDPNAEFRKFGKIMFGNNNLRRAIEIVSIWLVPQITTFFDFRFFEKHACNYFKLAFERILDERQTMKVKRNDLVDLLIHLRDNDENSNNSNGFKFEGDNLLAQAMIFFAAGYDTSSTTISFTLYALAKNQEIQTKLRNEIIDAIQQNNGQITYEMITELQYLDMVIAESLRMYPTLAFIDRKAIQDYKIEETGLIIEKGTPIIVPMLGLHYDPKYFTNPEVFDPENFSDFNKASRNPYVYMPFGIGPRSCIGMRQGLLQSKVGLAHIISRFEVKPENDASVEIDHKSLLLTTKGGLFLKIRKIDTESN